MDRLRIFVLCTTLVFLFVAGNVHALGAEASSAAIITSAYVQDGHEVTIPQIRGLPETALERRLNSILTKQILTLNNSERHSTLHGTSSIAFYNNKLLAIHFTGYSFTKPSAHPTKIDVGIHVDVRTGTVYTLSDLFRQNVDYEARIRKLCFTNPERYRLKIAELWDGWTYEIFSNSWIGADQSYLLKADSIRVYTIPSYATGPISGYRIPYADILDSINTDGALWQAIQQ